jgi:hypothetical protein
MRGLEAEKRRRACSGGVGVGAGAEKAPDIVVFTEPHLRDERGLVREWVAAFERLLPGAHDEEAFEAVLWYCLKFYLRSQYYGRAQRKQARKRR